MQNGLCVVLVSLLASRTATAGSSSGEARARSAGLGAPAADAPSQALLKASPRSWVVDAANNEIKAIRHEDSYLRYLLHSNDRKGDHVRDTIETKDGPVARLVRKDGRALTPDEDKAERDRLQELLNSPAAFSRHQKDEDDGKKIAIDLIRLLPDAMEFVYVAGQPQMADAPGPQVVIDYTPKPGWDPPTTISGGLKGLRGRVWIDARSHYVVRMEGEVFQVVNFGWGMVAHIYPGGTLSFEQRSVHPEGDATRERWIFTRFKDDLKVRAVMVKTIAIQSDMDSSRYQVLSGPPSYQDAIRTLLETPLPR